jgi:hypothetical protein
MAAVEVRSDLRTRFHHRAVILDTPITEVNDDTFAICVE